MAQHNNNNTNVHTSLEQGLAAAERQLKLTIEGFRTIGVTDMNGKPAFEDAKLLVQFFEKRLVAQNLIQKQGSKADFKLAVGDTVVGQLVKDFENGFTFVRVFQRYLEGEEYEEVPGSCKDLFLHINQVPLAYKENLGVGDIVAFGVVFGKDSGQLAAGPVTCESLEEAQATISDMFDLTEDSVGARH